MVGMRSDRVQRGAVSLDRVYPWADFFLKPPDDSSSSAPAQPLAAPDRSLTSRVRLFLHDQPVAQSLVVALPMIMLHEFPDGLPQRSFSKQDDPFETRFLD